MQQFLPELITALNLGRCTDRPEETIILDTEFCELTQPSHCFKGPCSHWSRQREILPYDRSGHGLIWEAVPRAIHQTLAKFRPWDHATHMAEHQNTQVHREGPRSILPRPHNQLFRRHPSVPVPSRFGSVLVLGWTYRLVRRSVVKHWWRLSPKGGDAEFATFLGRYESLRGEARWPQSYMHQ